MAVNPNSAFVWGPGGIALTPEQVALQRELLARQQAKGADFSPVGHWTQGAARVADALAGVIKERRLDKADASNQAYDATLSAPLADALRGGVAAYPESVAEGGSTFAPDAPGVEGPQVYRDAIASIESDGSGDYAAIGPTHPKMGRALGRYQIMEANLGPWGQEALGQPVSAEEFLANPKIQDAIFDHKFGGYVKQFGPSGAAQAWFAGPGGVGKTDRKDSLGTSVGAYAEKFDRALGRSAPAPVQVSSLDPSAGMGSLPETSPTASQPDVPTEPVGVGVVPAGTGGTPVLDVTAQPHLSAAANIPFVSPTGAPTQVAAVPVVPPVKRVSDALLRANDRALGGILAPEGTPQPANATLAGPFPAAPAAGPVDASPVAQAGYLDNAPQNASARRPESTDAPRTDGDTGYFPPAPSPQANNPLAIAVRALSDPRASPRTKAVAELVIKQSLAKQQADAEQQQWQQRQAYERAQQENDPKRKLEIEKLQREVNTEPTTDDIREYNLAVKQGETRPFTEWKQGIAKSGAANNTVNIDGEKKQDQTIGEGLGKDLITMIGEEKTARQTISSLNAMEKEMTDPNFYSGAGGQTVANLKRLAASMGIDPESVASTEAFNALSKKAVLDNMGGSLGTGVSNADRDYIEGQVPTINNTPQGNKKIIDITRRINERKVKVAGLARAYAKAHDGRLDLNFYDELSEWADKNPLFSDDERKAATTTPQGGTDDPLGIRGGQ
ncbi:hypothetical protein [Phyllobacterium chamaecytisi]|uniref:hypothetical protein n=1 Tax=Phyllobacterium chamaecytisi TaxID=2876082 RepID=UPI001CCA9DB8|nr:hypothetical protein [Phyllobacterium sp. KW56]MBZ9603998.1 hypothetical protein [Phyllobacterium sp. KW56]